MRTYVAGGQPQRPLFPHGLIRPLEVSCDEARVEKGACHRRREQPETVRAHAR